MCPHSIVIIHISSRDLLLTVEHHCPVWPLHPIDQWDASQNGKFCELRLYFPSTLVYSPRMRDWTLRLLIASMLFVSIEGMADSVDEASFHQTHHAHADNAGEQWFPDSDGDDHAGDACGHFCHAHVVGLTSQIISPKVPQVRIFIPELSTHEVTHSSAPPTPPPNA